MCECLAASHYRNEGICQVRQKSTLRQEYSILFARGSRPFYTQYSTLRGGQQQPKQRPVRESRQPCGLTNHTRCGGAGSGAEPRIPCVAVLPRAQRRDDQRACGRRGQRDELADNAPGGRRGIQRILRRASRQRSWRCGAGARRGDVPMKKHREDDSQCFLRPLNIGRFF